MTLSKRIIIKIATLLLVQNQLIGQSTVSAQTKIISPDRNELDFYGFSLDLSEDVLIVGALGDDTNEYGEESLNEAGAAYAYKRNNEEWEFVQKIVPNDRNAGDVFGGALAISGDVAVLTSSGNKTDKDDANSLLGAGAAFVFQQNEFGEWIQAQKLVASDRAEGDNFGSAIAISGDMIAVSARFRSDAQGAVYVFKKNEESVWVEEAILTASDAENNSGFGFSVAISGDLLAVGSWLESKDEIGDNSVYQAGAVYIFNRSNEGIWVETQKVVSNDRREADYFGYSLDLNNGLIAIGTPQQDYFESEFIQAAGAVYLFHMSETGEWEQFQKIVASDRKELSYFGDRVSLNNDYLAVGNPRRDIENIGDDSGAVYLFSKNESGLYIEIEIIEALDKQAKDEFGKDVKLNNDYLISGSFAHDLDLKGEKPLTNAGAIYLIKLSDQSSPQPPIVSVPEIQYGQSRRIELSTNTLVDEFRFISSTKSVLIIDGSMLSAGQVFDASSDVYLMTNEAGSGSVSFTSRYNGLESSVSVKDFQIGEVPLTIRAVDIEKTYGDLDPSLTYSLVNGELIDKDVLNGNLERTKGENAGEYTISKGDLSGGENYQIIFNDGVLTIKKAPLEVAVEDMVITEYDVTPSFKLHYNGFVNNEDVSVIDEEPMAFVVVEGPLLEGIYEIMIKGGSDDNYELIYENGLLTVEEALSAINSQGIAVYPNPTIDYINISQKVDDIEIYQLSGDLILRSSGANRVNLSSLQPGTFFLKILDHKRETLYKTKIVKQ